MHHAVSAITALCVFAALKRRHVSRAAPSCVARPLPPPPPVPPARQHEVLFDVDLKTHSASSLLEGILQSPQTFSGVIGAQSVARRSSLAVAGAALNSRGGGLVVAMSAGFASLDEATDGQ